MAESDYTLVPIMLENVNKLFNTIEASTVGDWLELNVSHGRSYKYNRWGVTMLSPGLPEDDSIDAYTRKFRPAEGMTVMDVGAHAGLTTYFFSKMVGDTGKVYAFEPDSIAREALHRNIANHNLSNVEVVAKAISGSTGTAAFNMDGSMAAGLVEHLVYANTGTRAIVDTITIEDFVRSLGRPVDYIKMDIEGAEVEALVASRDFIRSNRINFALDTYHRMPDGRISMYEVEEFFRQAGYAVESSSDYGEMFSWAWPK